MLWAKAKDLDGVENVGAGADGGICQRERLLAYFPFQAIK